MYMIYINVFTVSITNVKYIQFLNKNVSKLPCEAPSHRISKTHSKFLPENLHMLDLISCVAVGGDLERSPKEHYNF